MKMIITAGEALDYGWWSKICDLKGINEWAINEGQMDREEEIELTEKEVIQIGFARYLI